MERLWDELAELLALAVPISLNMILNVTMATVDLSFVGQNFGDTELAACALANVFFTLVTFPLNGYLTALDTKLGVAWGKGAYREYGDYFQTALFSVVFGCIGLALILLCGERIFIACGQDPKVALVAAKFAERLILGLWPYCITIVFQKYMNAQGISNFIAFINLIANILNIFFNWYFICHLGLGIAGSPLATSLSRWAQFVMNCAYLYYIRAKHEKTWPVWDLSVCLSLIGGFVRIALPGAAMLAVPTFSYEISTFLSGLLSVAEMGANSILIQLNGIMFMGSLFGLSIAGCIRVGNIIGQGKPPEQIKYAANVMVVFITIAVTCIAVVNVLFKDKLGHLFTEDPRILSMVSSMIPLTSFLLVLNAPALAYQAILLALGRQQLSFYINVVGFWVVGLPAGAFLTFSCDWGVPGLWWGIVIGMTLMAFLNYYYCSLIDWNDLPVEEEAGALLPLPPLEVSHKALSRSSSLNRDDGLDSAILSSPFGSYRVNRERRASSISEIDEKELDLGSRLGTGSYGTMGH